MITTVHTVSYKACCHSWLSHWSDCIDMDIVLLALNSKSIHQPNDAHLGSTVVSLAKVAIYTRNWTDIDNSKQHETSKQLHVKKLEPLNQLL